MTLITLLDGTSELGKDSSILKLEPAFRELSKYINFDVKDKLEIEDYSSDLESAFYELNKYVDLIPDKITGIYNPNSHIFIKEVESEAQAKTLGRDENLDGKILYTDFISELDKKNIFIPNYKQSNGFNFLGNNILVLTDKALIGDKDNDFFYGGTTKVTKINNLVNNEIESNVLYTILSTANLPKKEMLTYLAMHELGLVFKSQVINKYDSVDICLEDHCNSSCIMSELSSIKKINKVMRKLDRRDDKFCVDCQDQLRQYNINDAINKN